MESAAGFCLDEGVLRALLADADELAPDGGKAGGDKHVGRVIAEHAAIAADVGAIGAELALTGCVKDAGQDQQHDSSNIHQPSPFATRAMPTVLDGVAAR